MDLSRILIIAGTALILIGLLVGSQMISIGKLPGDFQFSIGDTNVYFPLATSLIISVILTVVLWFFTK